MTLCYLHNGAQCHCQPSEGKLCVYDPRHEWRPIETAPTKGVFLVYLPGERRNFEVMYRYENMSIVGGAFGFDRTKPTHWMPLPESP